MRTHVEAVQELFFQNPDEVFSSRTVAGYLEQCNLSNSPQKVCDTLRSLVASRDIVKKSHGHYAYD